MRDSVRQKVFNLIKEFLEDKPEGASYSEIISYLKEKLPNVPENTLHGATWHFRQKIIKGEEQDVVIPDKGFYISAKYHDDLFQEIPLKEAKQQEKTLLRDKW